MSDPGRHLHGWGYEGRTVDDLVDFAAATDSTVVVDVRLNPVSRRPGFSKRKLGDALSSANLDYRHLPELGNPRENRPGFAEKETPSGLNARQAYSARVLSTDEARTALTEIARLSDETNVIVLCFEADEGSCHRELVIEAARALRATATS